LNVMLPSWFIALVLTLVLSATGFQTASKALEALRKEVSVTGVLPWGVCAMLGGVLQLNAPCSTGCSWFSVHIEADSPERSLAMRT
jgi:predicted phage tail protein